MIRRILLSIIIPLLLTMCFNKNNKNINEDIENNKYKLITNDQTPLIIDINIGDEIILDGQIVYFNGWPPSIRMIVYDNKIIGVNDNNISEEIITKFFNYIITGKGIYKLKYLKNYDIPYYESPLMSFEIIEVIEYESIEINS